MSERKYYEAYDDRYRQVHAENLQWFAEVPSKIVAEVIGRFGILLSWIQGGSLRAYSLVIGIGVLFIMFILAFTFHSL